MPGSGLNVEKKTILVYNLVHNLRNISHEWNKDTGETKIIL